MIYTLVSEWVLSNSLRTHLIAASDSSVDLNTKHSVLFLTSTKK